MSVANPDPSVNLETHVFKENKAILCVPVYNKQQVCMAISQKKVAHITLPGDATERFYSYVTQKKRVPYCIVP